MNLRATFILKCGFVLFLLLLVLRVECKRRGSGGGGRRTGGGGGYTTPRSHNYQQQHHNTGDQDKIHQTNTYQTNSNNPQYPSAPIAPSSSNTNIGFENFNQQHGSQANRQGIGFENVQNRVPSQNSQAGPPVGFNVGQNNQPAQAPGFNVPQQNYHPPQGGYQNTHNQPSNAYNPSGSNYNYNSPGTYHNNNNYNNHLGGGNTFNPHLQGGSGYYNPNLAQPNSYYNPHIGTPGGFPPPIYQPVQQSSGSSFLGYAGSFAGGYLIGKLTSGGGHNSENREYTVHHYHHNRDEIPKRTSVSNNSLVVCSQNETQGLCVPNTFPICLMNGTIMCVTHLPYTVPCQNQSMSCVITTLPCANGTSCNATTDNTLNTAVYVPCISNVTVAKPSELQGMALPESNATNTNQTNQVELCITAIAEPKRMESPAMSYLNVIEKLLEFPFDINISSEISFGSSIQNSTNTTTDGTTTETVYVSSNT